MMDQIASKMDIDPLILHKKNIVQLGDDIPIAMKLGEGQHGYPAKVNSTGLNECLERGKELIGWSSRRSKPEDKNSSKRNINPVKSGLGLAAAAQGSGIPGVDMGAVFIKMNEDASFNLLTGATDIGTGSDTALAQIAAEELEVPVENIIVYSSDTDFTPFDTGAYASSTIYISGGAVKIAAERVKAKILALGMKILDEEKAEISKGFVIGRSGKRISYEDICTKTLYTEKQEQIMATASKISFDSPAPYNATFADVSVDTETGIVKVNKIVSITDSGQIINPQMAEGQVDGAIPQSLGMALSEFMVFNDKGAAINLDLKSYHIYSAIDMPEIIAEFIPTHEPTGPFGAKAAAEIPINGPAPAVVNAIHNACGIRIRELPVTPEKILKGLGKI
jgi:putative selenate reductase molybdopterin-binding subunit